LVALRDVPGVITERGQHLRNTPGEFEYVGPVFLAGTVNNHFADRQLLQLGYHFVQVRLEAAVL
jgi:hypothetical protein